MDLKPMVQMILISFAVQRVMCTIGLEFCSGRSIKDYFEGSSSTLKLDGSNEAVKQWPTKSGKLSCTCVVTPRSPSVLDKLHVNFVYKSWTTVVQSCNKNIEVRDANKELKHIFACRSEVIEIQDEDEFEDGIHFTLNWFGNSETSDAFYLYITPEPGSVLQVTCFSPSSSQSTTSSSLSTTSKINSTESSTSKVSSTTRAFVTAESSDSMIVVGVIVFIGLLFLVLITCLLCFIARRKMRREQLEEKNRPSGQTVTHTHNPIRRTLTHFYDKMKTNRPLPSIPSSFRNIHPFKSRKHNQSGTYDSIKSNNSNAKQVLDKQYSQSSDCSYLEPIKIRTISENVSNIKTKQEESNIGHQTDKKRNAELQNSNAYSANDFYILPKYVAETDNKEKGNSGLDITEDGNASKQMYMNLRELGDALNKDTLELDNVEAQEDGVDDETCCPDYIRMNSTGNNDTDQQKMVEENVDDIKSNKSALIETDSSGYMPMSSVHKINKKPVIEQSDSIFPQLISFTPSYETETNVKDAHNEEINIIKTKRYVKATQKL